MAKQYTDEELNLRRMLRRRLIGAAALTLAVVVILPMVLDSEPKSSGEDIELRIPAADKVGEFVPGKVTEEVYDTAASAVSAAAPDQPVVASAATAPAVPPSLPITIAAPAPASAAKAPAPVPAAPAPVKAQAAPAKPQVHQVVAAKPVAEAGTGGFVAQVGAYSSADTAKHELAQLKAWGFKAYTEKAGKTIRVRVGPYVDRDKAEKVRTLLEKHGQHPVVTSAK
jgi:DedD protein